MPNTTNRVDCGGSGGRKFEPQVPLQIGFRGEKDVVCGIQLNGSFHGGNKGEQTGIHAIDEDDYWRSFELLSSSVVEYIKLVSHKGKIVEIGNRRPLDFQHMVRHVLRKPSKKRRDPVEEVYGDCDDRTKRKLRALIDEARVLDGPSSVPVMRHKVRPWDRSGRIAKLDYVAEDNIRIIAIEGRASSKYLNALSIQYITDYKPSNILESGAYAVLDIRTSSQKFTEYDEISITQIETFDQICKQSSSLHLSAQAEIKSWFSISTGIKTTNEKETTEKSASSFENAKKAGRSVTSEIPHGTAAFLIAQVTVMKDAAGKAFLKPEKPADWIKLPEADFGRLHNYYDLTSGASLQAGLSHTKKHGLDVLAAPKQAFAKGRSRAANTRRMRLG